jgi:glycosyltransferase involved in cell wall biosynthesis
MRICRIVTIPSMFAYHLRSQIKTTLQKGHEVFLVSRDGSELTTIEQETGALVHRIFIARSISPWSDIISLIHLYRYFRRMNFDIVHSLTEKGGLLTSLAGRAACVPIRLHTFTGQAWMHLTGPIRWLAKACNRIIVKLNTQCYADSESQKKFLIQQGIANHQNIKVLGHGSLSGVDLQKFNAEKWMSLRQSIKNELNIPTTSKIINFTGRINIEKGVRELIESFEKLILDKMDIFLLLVGGVEKNREPLSSELIAHIYKNNRIRIIGNTPTPEKYYSISDLLCLPSYREGFGNVVIEAGAMEVPAVGTQVIGLLNSIIDGKTGLLVPPYDSQALSNAIKSLLENDELRKIMGKEARKFSLHFDEKDVNRLMVEEYDNLAKNILPIKADKHS